MVVVPESSIVICRMWWRYSRGHEPGVFSCFIGGGGGGGGLVGTFNMQDAVEV